MYLIMLVGRWSSDAFLRYISKQVDQFSHDVYSKMIENIFNRYIPAPTDSTTDRDPRQRNNPNNVETQRNNVGGNNGCIFSIHLTCVYFIYLYKREPTGDSIPKMLEFESDRSILFLPTRVGHREFESLLVLSDNLS